MLIPLHDITGVVLCGGEGRRMGGADKPLLMFDDRPLVAHVLERLAPQVRRIVISANRHRDRYAGFGREVVGDEVPGLGPLGGLATIATQVTTPWLFVCPGDAPRLDRTLVARLAAALINEEGAFPADGERAHYLFLLVRTAACRSLPAYLAAGGRSVHGWLGTLDVHELHAPDISASFRNVNTRDALAALLTEDGY